MSIKYKKMKQMLLIIDSSDESDEEMDSSEIKTLLYASIFHEFDNIDIPNIMVRSINNTLILTQRIPAVRIINYIETCRTYSNNEFISHFRVDRSLANDLIQRFSESNQFVSLGSAGREKISAERHILVFLWFAGHQASSYRDVSDRFNITLSALFDIITRVSEFLITIAQTVIRLPTEIEKKESQTYFFNYAKFPGVIGALDGTHIKIDRPSIDPDSYLNRKSYYSIHMQALVNENAKFMHILIGYPGSVHDARVFRESDLVDKLENLCDVGTYILGDSAYPLLLEMMTPYRDNGFLTRAQKNFNYRLSKCRIVVEHAFGNLKQRFRQLYSLKLRSVIRSVKFIHACCVLHNLADENDLKFFEHCNKETLLNENIIEEIQISEVDASAVDLRNELARQFVNN